MTHLKQGDKAPDFTGVDQDGNLVSLSDFKDKMLVLYFYPKDNTPGCTLQACNLRDNYSVLKSKGISILGVSADSEEKHRKFIEKYDLPFPLLADTDKKICKAYGVWGEKKFMGKVFDGIHRSTFLIDENSLIRALITKVTTKNHTEQILSILN
ncbi:MAG: thioredoxin-dependent thiol peroxidase [Bacteroidetes bacterium]|nr:thioredoxin-dependent thiol peroxidase [Bacteroidota bacterium]HET6244100.1 thioredoxin-dependent thiol peroxidase [Bacteroidia bacterium]